MKYILQISSKKQNGKDIIINFKCVCMCVCVQVGRSIYVYTDLEGYASK